MITIIETLFDSELAEYEYMMEQEQKKNIGKEKDVKNEVQKV